jgi:hypothetical protein
VWNKQNVAPGQSSEVEVRLASMETQLNTALGVLALMQPAATVLKVNGADKAQQQKLFDLIDEMSKRVDSGCSVSFSEFEDRVSELVPARRGDRKFSEMLIEALKLERPASKPMLDYLTTVMSLFRR